jgi:EmrB/QacA subfamily drug resistance transporter
MNALAVIPRVEPVGKTMQRWAIAMTGIASFMVALDTLVVSTALTPIRLDLGASLGELEWTINAYTLSFAGLLMLGSATGDRYGRRRTFAAGIVLFVAASAACALAPSVGWLIAARTVQGVGGAFVMPLAMALLVDAFPPEQRAKALGIFSSVTGLAVLGGPVIGGAIAQGLDWQWIFWINVPIGLVALPFIFGRLRESRGPSTDFDLGGSLLATAAGLALIWGLVRGNSVGWSSGEVVFALAAGVVLIAAFVAWERRTAHAMLPLRLFQSGAFSGGIGSAFFLNAALIGFLFFVTQFLQTGQGDGPLSTGVRLLAWTATLFFVAPLAGAQVNRLGARIMVTGGLAMQAAGFAWIALIARPDLPYWELVAPLIVAGCGVSFAMVASQATVVSDIAQEDIGKASGAFTTFRFFGGAFGIAILAAVFAGRGGYASPHAFSTGFVAAAAVAAALSAVGAAIGIAVPGGRTISASVDAVADAA